MSELVSFFYLEGLERLILEVLAFLIFSGSLFIITLTLLLRYLRSIEHKRKTAFLKRWRMILAKSIFESPHNLPKLKRREIFWFLHLWNHHHQSLKGEKIQNLNDIIYKLKLERVILKMLKSIYTRKKIIAIISMGHLRNESAWSDLEKQAQSDNSFISLMAIRSLCKISVDRAIPFFLSLLVERDDYPFPIVNNLMKEIGSKYISRPLVQLLENGGESEVSSLMKYFHHVYQVDAEQTIRRILMNSCDQEVIARCIKYSNNPKDLDSILKHSKDSFWPIRMQVGAAIGRVGNMQNLPTLLTLIDDEVWWVRYRSAQALLKLPDLENNELGVVTTQLVSAKGKSAVQQVMLEREHF